MNIEPKSKILKTRLRKDIRHKRAALSDSERVSLDSRINQQLVGYSEQTQPGVVAAYRAFDGEPDLFPSLSELLGRGVTLALPVIEDTPGKAVITFRRWHADGEMQRNRYGILEPAGAELIPVTDIDLVLIPLVGWSTDGSRLGMGASFYDRLFQPFAELPRPERIGVGYQLQQADSIPNDPWDIRLHSILTENGLFTCGE